MATITTGLSNAFKLELLKGNHDFDSDTMRVALIKENHADNYDNTTVSYSELGTDQATGSGYDSVYDTLSTGATATLSTTDASGSATTYPQMASDGTTAILDFNDAVFQSVTTAADGCILYNPQFTVNNIIAIFDFGGTVSATSGDFTVQFPAPGASTSILRLA